MVQRVRWASASLAVWFMVCSCAPQNSRGPSPPEPPTSRPGEQAAHAGLQNVLTVAPGIISGSGPDGRADFESLRAMGVRTIISVDGTTPDVAAARAAGLRYVHLPVGYDGVPVDKQRQIARALRDLAGPVYVHCHHGKHRGPAAAAGAAVVLGLLSPVEGLAFLKKAGTGEMYAGLFACVREAKPAQDGELESIVADFPEIAQVGDLVAAMVEIDATFEHLRLIQKAGWRVPDDHPDLSAADEAHRLETLLATSAGQAPCGTDTAVFRRTALGAAEDAKRLRAILSQRDIRPQDLDAELERVRASCQTCHAEFRDRRPRTGG